MKNQIQKYEPMMMVTMKDGRILFYPQSKDDVFYGTLKTETFVNIEGIRVNKFEIKYIEVMPVELDLLAFVSEDVRAKALERINKFKRNLGQSPTRQEKMKIIEKVTNEIQRRKQTYESKI